MTTQSDLINALNDANKRIDMLVEGIIKLNEFNKSVEIKFKEVDHYIVKLMEAHKNEY